MCFLCSFVFVFFLLVFLLLLLGGGDGGGGGGGGDGVCVLFCLQILSFGILLPFWSLSSKQEPVRYEKFKTLLLQIVWELLRHSPEWSHKSNMNF